MGPWRHKNERGGQVRIKKMTVLSKKKRAPKKGKYKGFMWVANKSF